MFLALIKFSFKLRSCRWTLPTLVMTGIIMLSDTELCQWENVVPWCFLARYSKVTSKWKGLTDDDPDAVFKLFSSTPFQNYHADNFVQNMAVLKIVHNRYTMQLISYMFALYQKVFHYFCTGTDWAISRALYNYNVVSKWLPWTWFHIIILNVIQGVF